MITGKFMVKMLEKEVANLQSGDKVLIADNLFPLNIRSGDSNKVYLAVETGQPTAPEVLRALTQIIKVEKAEVMKSDDGVNPDCYPEFREILGEGIEMKEVDRYDFFDLCCEMPVRVSFGTGEDRRYGNILVTIQ